MSAFGTQRTLLTELKVRCEREAEVLARTGLELSGLAMAMQFCCNPHYHTKLIFTFQ